MNARNLLILLVAALAAAAFFARSKDPQKQGSSPGVPRPPAPPSLPAGPPPSQEELLREAKEFDLPDPPSKEAPLEEVQKYVEMLDKTIKEAPRQSQRSLQALKREYTNLEREKVAQKHKDEMAVRRAERQKKIHDYKAKKDAEHPRDPNAPPRPPYVPTEMPPPLSGVEDLPKKK